MSRLEILNEILDKHISHLSTKDEPMLNDTKQLVELLKAIDLLNEIKRNEGSISKFDSMSTEDLSSMFNDEEE